MLLTNLDKKINQEYLYYTISSAFVQKQFNTFATGSTVKNLNKGIRIPLPNLEEQQRIVEEYSFEDKLVQDIEYLITTKKETTSKIIDNILKS